MQVDGSHVPPTSGLTWLHVSPGPQTGIGAKMFPPHGPPGPDTQWQGIASGPAWHVLPVGHVPPQVPNAGPPQMPGNVVVVGRTQSAAGPGQQLWLAVASMQMHTCSHWPFVHRSTVHPLPS